MYEDRPTLFDRFATRISEFVSRAWFFLMCVLAVVVWAPTYFVLSDVDTWQLVINTLTTIVTFLLVALLQNTQKRADDANQKKLNVIALALASLVDSSDVRLKLHQIVGIEEKESA